MESRSLSTTRPSVHIDAVLSPLPSVDLNAADTGVQLKPATTQQERKPQSQANRGKGGGCC